MVEPTPPAASAGLGAEPVAAASDSAANAPAAGAADTAAAAPPAGRRRSSIQEQRARRPVAARPLSDRSARPSPSPSPPPARRRRHLLLPPLFNSPSRLPSFHTHKNSERAVLPGRLAHRPIPFLIPPQSARARAAAETRAPHKQKTRPIRPPSAPIARRSGRDQSSGALQGDQSLASHYRGCFPESPPLSCALLCPLVCPSSAPNTHRQCRASPRARRRRRDSPLRRRRRRPPGR